MNLRTSNAFRVILITILFAPPAAATDWSVPRDFDAIQEAINSPDVVDGRSHPVDLPVINATFNQVDMVTMMQNTLVNPVQGVSNWLGSGWLISQNEIVDLRTRCGGGIGVLVGDYAARSPNHLRRTTLQIVLTPAELDNPTNDISRNLGDSRGGESAAARTHPSAFGPGGYVH